MKTFFGTDAENHIGYFDRIWERVKILGEYTRSALANIKGVTVRDIGVIKSGIVSFTVEGKTGDEVKKILYSKGINVSWNGRSNTFLDMNKRGLEEIVRASVHYYNREEEIDTLCLMLNQME